MELRHFTLFSSTRRRKRRKKRHKMMKDNAKMGSKWAFLRARRGPVPSSLYTHRLLLLLLIFIIDAVNNRGRGYRKHGQLVSTTPYCKSVRFPRVSPSESRGPSFPFFLFALFFYLFIFICVYCSNCAPVCVCVPVAQLTFQRTVCRPLLWDITVPINKDGRPWKKQLNKIWALDPLSYLSLTKRHFK